MQRRFELIEFKGVTKVYGKTVALDNATLFIPSGVVAAFLGPNGAGKTTSMKLIAGFIKPTHGEVKVFGLEPWRSEDVVRSRIGFLPEKPVYPANLTVEEYLTYLAKLRKASLSDVNRVIKLVGLESYREKRIKHLSRGYLQRVGLAQTLLGDPELLLLDEPTANLDPAARKEILNLIATLHKDLGLTIVISSHIVPELQEVANYAVFINSGRVLDYGYIRDLANRYGASTTFEIECENSKHVAQHILLCDGIQSIRFIDRRKLLVEVSSQSVEAFEGILQDLQMRGEIKSFKFFRAGLGELYEKVVGESKTV